MSATVKLSASLPGNEDTNGVDALVGELIDDPRALRFAVVWFDTKHVTLDTDSGDSVPTIRIRRFEPIGLVGEVNPEIRAAVAVAHELRTGRTPLPFDDVIGRDDDDSEIED